MKKVAPRYSLLLNVMRDQLDRFGEIDTTAKMLHKIANATTAAGNPKRKEVAMSGGRFSTQDNNDDAWVGVSSDGYHRDTDTPVASEFLIQEKGEGGSHHHLGFDEDGNELFNTER